MILVYFAVRSLSGLFSLLVFMVIMLMFWWVRLLSCVVVFEVLMLLTMIGLVYLLFLENFVMLFISVW